MADAESRAGEAVETDIRLKAVADAVAEITAAKRGVADPCLARLDEIQSRVGGFQNDTEGLLRVLRPLCRRGVLEAHLDINKRPMFKPKQ